MKIFGLTEKQIIKLRQFWLNHHSELPDDSPDKIVILKIMNGKGVVIEALKGSEEAEEWLSNGYKVIQEYSVEVSP